MKVPNFQGDKIYRYIIAFSDGGEIRINTDYNGNIVNYDVVINGKLVKNYTKPYTEIPDNEIIADIYKATNGVFDWKKTSIGMMVGGDGGEGFEYKIKSNLTAYEIIYNNLPAVEVTAKVPAKNGANRKKIVGAIAVVLLFSAIAEITQKRKR